MLSSEDDSTSSQVLESPPPSEQTSRSPVDASRSRLHQLAGELVRTQNRRLLAEFLTLRRAMR